MSQGGESEEGSAVEAARSQLAQIGQELSGTGAIGAADAAGRLTHALRPGSTLDVGTGGRFARVAFQVDLAMRSSESTSANARVATLLALAMATVTARIRVTQVHLRVADVVFTHPWSSFISKH